MFVCLLSKMIYDLFLGKQFSGAGDMRGQSKLFVTPKLKEKWKYPFCKKMIYFCPVCNMESQISRIWLLCMFPEPTWLCMLPENSIIGCFIIQDFNSSGGRISHMQCGGQFQIIQKLQRVKYIFGWWINLKIFQICDPAIFCGNRLAVY